MERRTIVRILRAVRRRKRWSQRQLGARLGISRSQMSRWETAGLVGCSVVDVERWATALGAHLTIELRVDGERPQADAHHAMIQNWLVGILRTCGWLAEPEISFNVYGDRGRIDVLAYHPLQQVLLVVEIKTLLTDAQDVLGRLDVKRRVGPIVAKERGWKVAAVVPMLLVREGSTARRRLAAHPALFASFGLRARAAMSWLRQPRPPLPLGLLVLVSSPKRAG
jgi:transcriptional regulator with XRE-family HTH domain